MNEAIDKMPGPEKSLDPPSISHTLSLESKEDEERPVPKINPRIELNALVATRCNGSGCRPPRVGLINHPRVTESSKITESELDFLTAHHSVLNQSFLESDWDKSNVVRIKWSDIVADFYQQANFVFGYVDKKAFFDWKNAESEVAAAQEEYVSAKDFNRFKAQRKRSRMVEGLKEKWYSFLLMDALRFITEGEGFGFPTDSRTQTMNMKYYNGISSFNVPFDGATPFFRQGQSVMAPAKYATYNEDNELSPDIMRAKMPVSLKASLDEIGYNARSVTEQPERKRESRIDHLNQLLDDIDATNAYMCCPLTDRLKERSFNQHAALQISMWNVYVMHVKKLMLVRQADGLPLWDTWPSVELDMSDELGLEFSSYARFRDAQVWHTRLSQTFKPFVNDAIRTHEIHPYNIIQSHTREFMSLAAASDQDRWLLKLLQLTGYSAAPVEGVVGAEPGTVRLEHDGSAPYQLAADVRLSVLMNLTHIVNSFPAQLAETVMTQMLPIGGGMPSPRTNVKVPLPLRFATHYNWELQEIVRTHKDNRLKELVPLGPWRPPVRAMNLPNRAAAPSTVVIVSDKFDVIRAPAHETWKPTPGTTTMAVQSSLSGSSPVAVSGLTSSSAPSANSSSSLSGGGDIRAPAMIVPKAREKTPHPVQNPVLLARQLAKDDMAKLARLLMEHLRNQKDTQVDKFSFSTMSAALIITIRDILEAMPLTAELGPCLGYFCTAAKETPIMISLESKKQPKRKNIAVQPAPAPPTHSVSSSSSSSSSLATGTGEVKKEESKKAEAAAEDEGDDDSAEETVRKPVPSTPPMVMNPELYKQVVMSEKKQEEELMRIYDAAYSTISRLRGSKVLDPKVVVMDKSGGKKRGRAESQEPHQAKLMNELTALFQKSNISAENALSPYIKIGAHSKLGLGPGESSQDFSWSTFGKAMDDYDDNHDEEEEYSRERMDEEEPERVGHESTKGKPKSPAAVADDVSSEMDTGEGKQTSEFEEHSGKIVMRADLLNDKARAYNWYYYHDLSLLEKKQYIEDGAYKRKAGMGHGKAKCIITLESYKRFLNDIGLSILSSKLTNFDQTFISSLPRGILECRVQDVLAPFVNDAAVMAQLSDRIFNGAVKNLGLQSVYPMPEVVLEDPRKHAWEAPYEVLESLLGALLTKLKNDVNLHENRVKDEYNKLPMKTIASPSNLENIQEVVQEELGDGSSRLLKKLQYTRKSNSWAAAENDISTAQALGAAEAVKEMAKDGDDDEGEVPRRGTRNRTSNTMGGNYFQPPLRRDGPGRPRLYNADQGEEDVMLQVESEVPPAKTVVPDWKPVYPPVHTGRDSLWPPIIKPYTCMTKYLHYLLHTSAATLEEAQTRASQGSGDGASKKDKAKLARIAVEKVLGREGFMVDKSNKLRFAVEVMIVHANYAILRHPYSLRSPVDLLREFDRFSAERDRLWALKVRAFRFYQSRGFKEGMEPLPKRRDWETYLWSEMLKDLPALLAFYNCLLFTRDLLLPENSNVHHALYVTSMVLGGDVRDWEKGYRGATSVQCVIRQMMVWRMYNQDIYQWSNWIMCDDDPISRQVLDNLNLNSFDDDDNNYFASDASDDEFFDGDFVLSPEDVALNNHQRLQYSLTYLYSFPKQLRWSSGIPLTRGIDAAKPKTTSALETTQTIVNIMKQHEISLKTERINFKKRKLSVKRKERSVGTLAVLRSVFRDKPRVTHVFATIPWTSVIRYFYTVFSAYTAAQNTNMNISTAPQAPQDPKTVQSEQAAPFGEQAEGAKPKEEASVKVSVKVADLHISSSGFFLSATSGTSNIIATPAVHFMKARLLLLDAMMTLVQGMSPTVATDGRFDHHREFQVAVWAAATGKFIKKEANDGDAKESLIYQRSLTNSKLVKLGVKLPYSKRVKSKAKSEMLTSRRPYGRELPPNVQLKLSNGVSTNRIGRPLKQTTEIEDDISAADVVEVGKCRVDVDYIGYPWKDFHYLQQPPPLGDHIKNRNERIDPETIEALKIEEAFRGFERDLADYALNSPHKDTLLVRDLQRGKINMHAFITLAVNQLLLSTDAAVVDRRSLNKNGQYEINLATRRSRQGAKEKRMLASEARKKRKTVDTKHNVYKRVYRTKKKSRDADRKSINRDPNAPMWMTKRRGAAKGPHRVNPYNEMINSILPHHPDGEEDDDDKRANHLRLQNSSISSSLSNQSMASASNEREQSRVGTDFQAAVPSTTAAGSTGGLAGASSPDPVGSGDTVATVSTLVSSTEQYQDPTAADQADQSIFRFDIVYNEPADSDFEYKEEEGLPKPWSKIKRAVKFRKAAMSAKRQSARDAGLVPDEESVSGGESDTDEEKTSVSNEKDGAPLSEGLGNINHLLLQGLGAVPVAMDTVPGETEEQEAVGKEDEK